MTLSSTADGPLPGYRTTDAFDEMFDGARPRPHWADVAATLDRLGDDGLRHRVDEIRLLLQQDGVTYNVGGGGRRRHRPWRLDPIPLVLTPDEWRNIERGVTQRLELLNLVMADLYGERRLLKDGIIPPAMILADPQFDRVCDGIAGPETGPLTLGAVDLARTANGWMTFGHRTQAPSGAAYALENRRVLSRVFPALFARSGVQRLAPYLRALRSALRAAAPTGTVDPSVVVYSPGPLAETAFEHASIAALLGYPLVQGGDLKVENGTVWLRTVARPAPVDVILRRVDSQFADSLELLPTSTLGIPGLVDACRTRSVSVANPLGSGVLENAGLHTVLPQLARRLLDADLAIDTVETWWCGDPASASHVLANLSELILRHTSRADGEDIIDPRSASAAELDELARRIRARPEHWVGQERVAPATTPTVIDSSITGRPTVLRSFGVAAPDGFHVMTGGLARAAGADIDAPITKRHGAVAKDVWVIGAEAESIADFWLQPPARTTSISGVAAPARAADNLFWLGRYAERAEAAVRLLRIIVDRRDEFLAAPGGPGQASLNALLEALTRITATYPGFVGDDARRLTDDPSGEIVDLVVNDARPGTVAHAIECLYEAIDMLTDQLSIDTWLVVGSLQGELDRLKVDSDESEDELVANVLNALLQGLLALSGLVSESMVRDDAWRFLDAGRRLERALQITALATTPLAVERGAAAESLLVESILTAGESIITYRRRYRSQARVATVIDLLIADAGNPRSLRFQLDALRQDLAQLRRGAAPTMAESLVIELITRLDATAVDDLAAADRRGRRTELDELGAHVRDVLHRISDAVTEEFFARQLPQRNVLAPAESPRAER